MASASSVMTATRVSSSRVATNISNLAAVCTRNNLHYTRICVSRAASSGADSASSTAVSIGKEFEHILLPIMDKNPYLSDATKQAAATTTSLAKRYGAKITVVVIDEKKKEEIQDYEVKLKSIQWHLAQGGYEEYGVLEKLGEEKRAAVVIGEVADDMGLDLVVLSMDSIHSKRIDGNLLAEFVPCPLLLLPL